MNRADSLLPLTCAIVFLCFPGLVSAQVTEPLHFAADRPVDCLHIRLEVEVDLERKRLEGTATLDLTARRDVSSVRLDAVDLSTSSLRLSRAGNDAAPVKYINDGKTIDVLLGEPLKTGEKIRLFIDYAVDDPASGLHFFSPSRDEPDVPRVVWSQGESTFNSYWFPCFDHPNERQTTELIVTAKQGYEISSNGRLISRQEDAARGTVTAHWRQDTPHVAYLVSLIVGEFHITRETWRGKPVEYWVHPRYAEQVGRTFQNTIRMLDFFTDRIGVDYPWDRYAQICCEGFGGGMENTAATTLGNRALHDQRSFLDANSDGLIAHELAHQWWGDLLTCRDWAHIWLNEGFASYFEALWAEHDGGRDEFAYNMYRKGLGARRGGRERPIVDRGYNRPRDMFDARAYPKGAWVLHMMRRRLGDDLFWKVLHHYATSYAFQCVETVDLRRSAEEVTGRSLERFFYDWTERPGHPEVSVSFKWLAEDRLARVEVKQTQKAAAFHFPLTLEFRFESGSSPLLYRPAVTEKDLTLYYPLHDAPTALSVDPEQAVLMELTEEKGRNLWKTQLLADPGAVARIRAARHFGASKAEIDRQLLADALERETFWGVRREIAAALAETGGDVARDALIAGLRFDHPKARRACAASLASFRGDQAVAAAVRPLVVGGDPSYYVETAAIDTYARCKPPDALEVLKGVLQRDSRLEMIRSAALSGLGQLDDAVAIPLLCEWTRPDKPRRCRPAAIRSLARVTRHAVVGDASMAEIVDALSALLGDQGTRVRLGAVEALGSLSEPSKARSTLSDLERLAASDPEDRVRRAAGRTIEAIQAGKPAQVQVSELREQLRDALEQNKTLSDRLERIESRLKEDS